MGLLRESLGGKGGAATEHFERAGLSARTLQQRFSSGVGVTPKRVARRYRPCSCI